MSALRPRSECTCSCHVFRGTKHFTACCDGSSLGFESNLGGMTVRWNPYEGPDFNHYLIERNEAGLGWKPLYLIEDKGQISVTDYTSRFGVQTSYRVRVMTTTGPTGQWVLLNPEIT